MENLDNKIELLAKGKLSPDEAAQLMQDATTNLDLKSEINYQNYISKAIVEHRKLALKARLQAIQVAPITGSIFGGLSTNSILAIKSAAVVVASLGLGASVYLYSQSNNSSNTATNEAIAPVEIKTNVVTENSNVSENITSNADVETSNIVENNTEIVKNNVKVIPKQNVKNTAISKKNVPNMLAFEDDSQAEINTDLSDTPLDKQVESHVHKITTIDIVNVTDSKYGFHYLLKDNILTLYGKFDSSLYEIIERNNNTSSSLYLFYNKNYYLLNSENANVQKLKKLDDTEIITELSDTRQSR